MSIFSNYPKVRYKVNDYDYLRAIDITDVSKIKNYLKAFGRVGYSPYVIRDGETPDYVSYKLYGSPEYDWVIMLTNNLYSIHDDWPKNSETFKNYIIDKYGNLNDPMTTIKYYYNNSTGNIIDSIEWNLLSAANRRSETEYEWELRKNTNKSKILVMQKGSLGALDAGLKSILLKPIV
jgi:hypothetical protein